jgi:hypothetical protein
MSRPKGPIKERLRRARGRSSKVLFATISHEHFAVLHRMAGLRSLGLTLEDLIEKASGDSSLRVAESDVADKAI